LYVHSFRSRRGHLRFHFLENAGRRYQGGFRFTNIADIGYRHAMPTDLRIALSDIMLPHQAADLVGVDERELWALVRQRRFPLPSMIMRLPCWIRQEVEEWVAGNREHLVSTPNVPRPRLRRPQ
jgi:predicted DNA-binding transcriptional regulator AlpA